MMGMFPLMFLVILVYVICATVFGGGDAASMNEFLSSGVASIPLLSGGSWALTFGDLLIVLGLMLLFVEIVQSTRIGRSSIVNHGLSMLVFVIALILFLGIQTYGTSTFFILMFLSLLDVIAGFTITIRTARRDIGFGGMG